MDGDTMNTGDADDADDMGDGGSIDDTGNGSDADTGDGDPSEADRFVESFIDRKIEAFCSPAFQCSELGAIHRYQVLVTGRFSSQQACEDSVYIRELVRSGTEETSDIAEEIKAGAAAGRLNFDADNADACLSAMDTYYGDSCAFYAAIGLNDFLGPVLEIREGPPSLNLPSSDPLSVCEDVFTGAVADEGSCNLDGECAADGAECETDSETSFCYGACNDNPGVVTGEGENLGEGEACEPGNCDEGMSLTCQPESTDGSDNSICIAEGSRGDGQACRNNDACQDGFFCTDDTCTAEGSVPAGGACEYNSSVCQNGLVCYDTIAVPTRYGGEGETCQAVEGGEVTFCQPGFYCGIGAGNNVCNAFGDQGEDCGVYFSCNAGLYCGADATCEPRTDKSAGDSCRTNFECRPGFRCDTFDEVCVEQAPVCTVPVG